MTLQKNPLENIVGKEEILSFGKELMELLTTCNSCNNENTVDTIGQLNMIVLHRTDSITERSDCFSCWSDLEFH